MEKKSQHRQKIELTIVIPAYREETRIGSTLDELATYLKHDSFIKHKNVEVMVVAADAPDNTHKVVLSKQKLFKNLRLLRPGPKVGKGRDVQYGMLRASSDAILFMDADLATPLKYIKQFYEAYERGFEVVLGTRNLMKHHPGYLRRMVSNGGNVLFRLLGGIWIEDSQCGFKLFSDKAAKVCFSKLTVLGWGFDMEILTIAKVNKFKIKAYPIVDWVSVPNGTFFEGMLRASLTSLRDLAIIFKNRVTGRYK